MEEGREPTRGICRRAPGVRADTPAACFNPKIACCAADPNMKPSPVRKFLLFVMLVAPMASAQTGPANPAEPSPPAYSGRPLAELSMFDAVVLGVVEGVTEFLPISSTGHLVIATRLLGLDSEAPLAGPQGEPMWFRPPSEKNPAGEPLTLKRAADTFTIVVQFGAIAAVAVLYWSQLLSMLGGLLGRDPAGLRLLANVLIAFLPAAIIGLIASNWIDAHLMSTGTVIVALVVGAGLMLYAEAWRKRRAVSGGAVTGSIAELRPLAALKIGLWQCLALWPGMSRSMTTIVGGYFAGLEPRRSAEFSFLLGFVTLSAASLYKALKSGTAMIQVFGWSNVALGAVVAAVTAAICVRFLVHWLTRHGLAMFAWYRIGVAAVLAAVFYL